MMQSTIPRRVPFGILLVPSRIRAFFRNDGKGKSTAHPRTFLTRSPQMPKFNVLNRGEIFIPYIRVST